MPKNRTDVDIGFNAKDNASDVIDDVGDALERVGDEKSGLLGGVSLGFASVVGGATAAGAALAANAKRWVDQTRQIDKSSKALGVNIEEYSELSYAFRQFNYEADDLDAILAELEIKTYDWAEGNQTVKQSFEELNLELDEFESLSPDEKLNAVASALSNIESNSRRIGIADAIFGGDDARKVLEVADSLNDLTDEAERLNLTVDRESARAAREFQRNMNVIEGAVESAANHIAEETVNFAAPIIEHFATVFGLLPDEAKDAADEVENVLRDSTGRIVFQAGVVGQAGGLNFAQRFVRQVEEALANWNYADAIARGRPAEGDKAADQIDSTDFLLRSGLFTYSLDGPSPFRDASAIGAGVDDITRGLLSNWVVRPPEPDAPPPDNRVAIDPYGPGGYGGTRGDRTPTPQEILFGSGYTAPGTGGRFPYIQGLREAVRDLFPDESDDRGYRGSFGSGGGSGGGSGQTINVEINLHFGEGVTTNEEIISTVQEGINFRQIATDIGEKVSEACNDA